jgi:hypothetical protein
MMVIAHSCVSQAVAAARVEILLWAAGRLGFDGVGVRYVMLFLLQRPRAPSRLPFLREPAAESILPHDEHNQLAINPPPADHQRQCLQPITTAAQQHHRAGVLPWVGTMSSADITRLLMIKTKVLKRQHKELSYYEKQRDDEVARVSKLKEASADPHDLRQAVGA